MKMQTVSHKSTAPRVDKIPESIVRFLAVRQEALVNYRPADYK
jgi:hypothetical protein